MAVKATPIERFTILCYRCDRPLLTRTRWIGWEVECPHCRSLMSVPEPSVDKHPIPATAPYLGPKFCFNFPCPRCACLLQANTGMTGKPADCPTCAARFMIPAVNPGTGRPEKAPLLERQDEPPTPVHAYGASGFQAPQIIRTADGLLEIQCSFCQAINEIDADNCSACGAPFTMEAAATIEKISTRRWVHYSITAGVLGAIGFPLLIPAALAMWWGARAAMTIPVSNRGWLGLIGLFLGIAGFGGGLVFWYVMLK